MYLSHFSPLVWAYWWNRTFFSGKCSPLRAWHEQSSCSIIFCKIQKRNLFAVHNFSRQASWVGISRVSRARLNFQLWPFSVKKYTQASRSLLLNHCSLKHSAWNMLQLKYDACQPAEHCIKHHYFLFHVFHFILTVKKLFGAGNIGFKMFQILWATAVMSVGDIQLALLGMLCLLFTMTLFPLPFVIVHRFCNIFNIFGVSLC